MNSSDPLDELHSAIERNNDKQVANLIANGVVPEIRSLFFAIKRGANDIVKTLLRTRTNIDDLEPYWRQTPLTRAIECKNHEALKMLLEAGASPNRMCRFGPPLIAAATRNFLQGAKALIAAGANLEQRSSPAHMTPLIVAAQMGHVEMVKLLLEAGANPLNVDILDRTAYEIAVEEKRERVANLLAPVSSGRTSRLKSQTELLLEAIKAQDVVAFGKCLAGGVDVNKRDRWGWNPLDRAVEVGAVEFVQKLVKAGANVNAHKKGVTALGLAVNKDRSDIAKILLKAGAVPKAETKDRSDSLWTVCVTGNLQLAELLLKHGANPNCANRTGETALMNAVGSRGSMELVQLLISSGAEVEHADNRGWTALFHAVQSNPAATFTHTQFPSGARLIAAEPLEKAFEDDRLIEIVRLLLDNGADINRRDNEGRTPPTFASTPGMARLLIHAGARLGIRDKQGHDVNYWLKNNGIAATLDSARGRSAISKVQMKSKKGKLSGKRRRM